MGKRRTEWTEWGGQFSVRGFEVACQRWWVTFELWPDAKKSAIAKVMSPTRKNDKHQDPKGMGE